MIGYNVVTSSLLLLTILAAAEADKVSGFQLKLYNYF